MVLTGQNTSPFAPNFGRCWMMARMGATPVPGPTHMTGVPGSSGRVTNQGWFHLTTRLASIRQHHEGTRSITYLVLRSISTCIPLPGGLSGEFYSLPWQRRGEFPSNSSSILPSTWVNQVHIPLPNSQSRTLGAVAGETRRRYGRGVSPRDETLPKLL